MSQTGEAAAKLSIPKIFGATDEDTDGLRIVSLYEVRLLGSNHARYRGWGGEMDEWVTYIQPPGLMKIDASSGASSRAPSASKQYMM